MAMQAATLSPLNLPKQEFSRPQLSDSNISKSARQTMRSELEVASIDPVQGPEWDLLVSSHPEANFFHGSAWARVLVNTYRHRPFYLRLWKDGKSVALVPLMEVASSFTGRRGVCLPFSDSCEPLIFAGADGKSALPPIQALAQERKWRYLEFRGASGLATPDNARPTFYGHTLDLRVGMDALFARLDSAVRRAIRKAEASDLTVQIERSAEAMEQFVFLHAQTRKRHGVPPQPALFFSQIHEQIIRPGLGFVVLARRGGIAVAAAIFFVQGTKAIYKFGASDETKQSLRGNNIVMWEAIRFLAANGVQQLDLGRTAPEHEGLRRFKLGWGTCEKSISYCRFEMKSQRCLPVIPRSPGISVGFFRRMPVTVNQVAGLLLYPHLD